MDNGDSDVEIEEEWEEVQLPQVPAVPAAERGDITIYLNADDEAANQDAAEGKKKRPAGRIYTKKEREDALMVHRVHCLCMLAHALVHDTAAADKELQALLVSLLPFELLETASAAASSEDPLAKTWLPKLLHWFHTTFTLTATPTQPQQQQQQQQQQAGPSSNRRRARGWGVLEDLGLGFAGGSVAEQLLACVSARSGSSTQLATLLVALLRAVGFLTRSVWSLDPLPFKPAAVNALQQGKSIRATTPAAAAAGRQGPAAAGSKRGRAKAPDKPAAAAAAAGDDSGPAGTAGGRGRGSKRGRGGRGSKAAAGSSTAAVKGSLQPPAAAAAAAAGDGGGDGPGNAPKRRRGDEEFERELAMALEATAAAEAASKKQAGSSVSRSGPASTSNGLSRAESRALTSAAAAAGGGGGSGGSGGGRKQQSFAGLIAKGASAEKLKRAAAASAAAVPAGWLWQPRQGALAAPKVWGEVYVGGSADGRWLHVDGLLGCYDQPTAVEAAVVRRQPLSYVVACQEGAPKDVTRRYAVNFLVNLKWRDEAWWSSTMAALRSTAAHLHPQLAAQVAAAAAPTAAATAASTDDAALAAAIAASLSDVAATAVANVKGAQRKRKQQQRQQPLVDAESEKQPQQQEQQMEELGLDATAAAVMQQPQRKRTRRNQQQQQQQQQEQQEQQQQQQHVSGTPAPNGAACTDDHNSDDVTITDDRPAPTAAAAAAAAATATAIAAAAAAEAGVWGGGAPGDNGSGSDGGSPTAAALRAAREEAELSKRAAQQAAGPPTTVDGFKAHPLYVLTRHITKYQAVRPGAVKLGLHKGEAYFSRQDVQELHTAERWEREGRQVRPDELDKPAKVAKKRALPAGGGGSGRNFGSSRGGWGPWQRSNSSSSMKAGSTAAAAADPGEGPPAAAAAAGGDQAGDKEGVEGVDSTMQQLYGLWQTDAFVRRAVDGKVPRNQRGNVEVPPLAKSLPEGTAWIDAPNVAPICRSLGIDYAPALVGFEVQGGRMVPRIRGVVVCEEHEQVVIEQHIKREAELAAADQAKRAKTAAAAWRRLLNHMWTKIELQRKYGATSAANGATGTDATAAGVGAGGAINAAAALGLNGNIRKLNQEAIGSLNAGAGGHNILQQQDATAVSAAAAAAAAFGNGLPGSSAAAADGVTVTAADVAAGVAAGQASGSGQQAARAGGGKAGVGRSSRLLLPGVRSTARQGPADAARQAAAAGEEAAAAGGSVGGQEQQQGVAELPRDAMEGVEMEEF